VARYEVDLERVSFKGTVDALRQYSAILGQARSAQKTGPTSGGLLLNLARDTLPYVRIARTRALKRRHKNFPC